MKNGGYMMVRVLSLMSSQVYKLMVCTIGLTALVMRWDILGADWALVLFGMMMTALYYIIVTT